MFRVKDIRSSIDSILLPSDAISTRWVKYVPIKINVFVWRARLDRLPTRVNLDRRGVIIDSVLCPLCGAVSEDISHVLFRCDLASRIFRRICRWWELDSQDLSSFADWDVWFSSIRRPSKSKVLLEGVFFVAWCKKAGKKPTKRPLTSNFSDDLLSETIYFNNPRHHHLAADKPPPLAVKTPPPF
ncbi:RNA-directed DNA polymerase, eukaryota [Tanacetum coccineum]